jgi:hypothetical protein
VRRLLRSIVGACSAALLVVTLSTSVYGQDSRAERIAAEQAAKAARLKPYEPGRVERFITELRLDRFGQPNGLYPYFDSVYSGGGFTLGAGYRKFTGDRTHWDLKGLYSLKHYKLIELSTDSWGHAQGKLDLHGRVGWRDATQVGFYGLGMETDRDDRADYRMQQGFVGGDVAWRPLRYAVFGAGAAYEEYTLRAGESDRPSIADVYTPDTAPGLGESPDYVHTRVAAAFDSRPSPGYARSGGLYRLTYHNYAAREDTFSFDRLDGDVVQHVPVLRENWVLSFRGAVSTTLDDDDQVPYYLLPFVGSGSTLRAYSSRRFRDRHSLLLTGEFRWIPSRLGLDMAVFYDAGKVASEWAGLSLNGMKTNVGIGARFHTPVSTPLRIEVAHGSDGLNVVFSGAAAF